MKTTINLKNYHLKSILKAINYNIPFPKGRVRRRFIADIIPIAKQVDESKREIVEKYAEKKDGKIVRNGNEVAIQKGKEVKFKTELDKLSEEEVIIDVSTQMRNDLPVIKSIIETSNVEVSDLETLHIIEFLDQIDEVLAKPKNDKKK